MTESTADPTMVEQFWNSINREAQEAGRGLFSEVFPAVADAWDGERLHIRREYADANDGVAYPVLSGGQPPELGKRVWCARVGDGAVVLGRVSEAADETISDLRQAIFDNDTDIAVLQQDKYNKTGGDVAGPVRVKTPANHVQMFDSDSGTQEDRWIIENRDQELRVYWFDNSAGSANIAFTISAGGITVFNQKLTALALQSNGPMDILGKINGGGRLTEFGGEIRTGGNIDAQNNTVFANTFNAANYIILGDTINPAGADAKFGGRVVAGGSVVAGGNVLADGGALVGDGLNVRSGNVGLPAGSVDGSRVGYESIDYTRIEKYTIGGVRLANNAVDTRVINMSDLFSVLDNRYAPYHFH